MGEEREDPLTTGLLNQQQENRRQIDQRLDAMVDASAQMKHQARQIGEELDDQNQMLQEVNTHMDRTEERLTLLNKSVKLVKESGSNCAGWCLVILLLAAIVVVWVVKM